MKRVTGIGGIFFKAKDAVTEWLYVFRIGNGHVEKVWSHMGHANGATPREFIKRLESSDPCFVSPPRQVYYTDDDACLNQ